MLSYVKLFYSFNSETSALTDAEVGRLVRQLLAFGERGDTQRYLRGNERLLFPVYRAQLERDGEKYAALSQTRAESGRAGGKARQRMAKSGKSGHDKDKAQEEEKEKEKEKGKDKEAVAAAVSARGGGDGLRDCNSLDSEPRPEPDDRVSEDLGDCDSDCNRDCGSDCGDCNSGCDGDCGSDCGYGYDSDCGDWDSDCDGDCGSDFDSDCGSDCGSDSDCDGEDSDEWIDVTAAFRSDGCEPHRAIDRILRRERRKSANSSPGGGISERNSANLSPGGGISDCNSAHSSPGGGISERNSAHSAPGGGDGAFAGACASENFGPEGPADTVAEYAFENLGALSPGNLAELEAFEETLSEAAIRFAVDQACANGVRKWTYARKILAAWRDQGIHTLAEAQAEARKNSPNAGGSHSGHGSHSGYGYSNSGGGYSNSGGGCSNPALNYEQRTYSESDFADLFVDLSAPLPGKA